MVSAPTKTIVAPAQADAYLALRFTLRYVMDPSLRWGDELGHWMRR